MHFVRWAAQAAAGLDAVRVAPGMTERLAVAAAPQEAQPADRTIAAPFYLTDLGVRRFSDPRVFFDAHVEHLAWAPPTAEDTRRLLLTLPLPQLASHLDAVVLLTGDYEVATDVVRAREAELVAADLHLPQLYAGVLLAVAGDPGFRSALLGAAAKAEAPTDRFMALHRLAAALIKRFGDPAGGIAVLESLDDDIDACATSGLIEHGDRRALHSVTANLRALAWLRLGDEVRAAREIGRSCSLATLSGLHAVRRSESARYTAQENINLAQIMIRSGDTSAGVGVLDDNVRFCRHHCPEYLGEALSALAYAQFLAGDHASSAQTALDAARVIAFEASPQRLHAAREIRIAALAAAGHRGQAARELERLERDPLGFDFTTDHRDDQEKPARDHSSA